ncbi:MAG TPA: TraR/DksA family transcriptional regulator [Burkholderiales bacterium]|nr:TraR/DksA family transcriptional regulator [Burkholderiales bacterium]
MAILTAQQLGSLNEQLDRQEAWLRKAIKEEYEETADQHYADLAGSVADEGDEAVADVLTDVENAVIGHYLGELSDIEAARGRVANRTYGVCIDCGADIDYARLVSYPTAKRCAMCQTTHERTHVGAAHSTL